MGVVAEVATHESFDVTSFVDEILLEIFHRISFITALEIGIKNYIISWYIQFGF